MAQDKVVVPVDTKKLVRKHVTLEVKTSGYKGWQRRMEIAKLLIRFAAWIAWFNVEFV